MENVQLTRLLDTVRGEGFPLSLSWETKRWKGDAGHVAHYIVSNGPDGKEPKMRSFVVTCYGPGDGYGLYGDADASTTITADVAAITGVPTDEVSLVA